MNRLFLSLISLAACMTSCTSPEPLTDYVDPRIGTAHSRWFFFTPAAVPFGMAKLAPTTDGHLGNPGGWQAVGYDARHTSIEGFANFHEFQVGGVVIAPTVGALQTVPGPLDDPEAGYRSRFDKKDEVARPGYYSVLLKDYGVKAELTATERVGFHRYTFPASEEANLIFNIGTKMGESGPARDASVTFTEDGRIEGWVVTEPVYVDIYQKGAVVKMYFSAVVDAEPASWGAFCGEEVFAGERSRTGVGAGVYLRFGTRARRAVGVEIGLFDSLNIIFDWFKEKRSGIFMQRTSLPSTFGMSGITPWANIGKVDNHGVDISVDYNKAFSKDLILSLRGTFTYAHNEIVEMDEPKYKWAYQYKAGHPINSIQCLIAEGLFRDEEEIASSPSQDIYATTYPIRPGDVKYRDLNDDKIIDDNDMCWTGNPTVPEIIYGFGFSLKYKGFDCSAFLQGQGKVSIIMYNYHPFATAATPGSGLMQWIADEHWSEDDPNPKALYPRLSPLWNNNNTKASTLYVRNGKMLRLKTAEIGYTYKKMRVYVSGTNLLTFAPFKYWDPEKGSGNGLGYPLQRTYNLGFQFNF